MVEESPNDSKDGISISLFENSVEKHFKAMDTIADLCGESITDFDESEIKRLSSSISFLREWRHYNYEPRAVRFSKESDGIFEGKDVNCISLTQYSSARVPKEALKENSSFAGSSKDFVMHVGGSVWALDWCPILHEKPDARIKCEYLAVSAHPPDSYHHSIGAPLTGRGMIQIWCILNIHDVENEVLASEKNLKCKSQCGKATPTPGKPKGRPRKRPLDESLVAGEPKRPRGRPRKNPEEPATAKKPKGRPRKKVSDEFINNLDSSGEYVQALAVQYPGDLAVPLAIECPSESIQETCLLDNTNKLEGSKEVSSSSNSTVKSAQEKRSTRKGGARSNKSMQLNQHEDGNHISHEQSMSRNQEETEHSQKSTSSSAVKLPSRRHKLKIKDSTERSSVSSDIKEGGSHQSCGQTSIVVSDVPESSFLELGSQSSAVNKDIVLPRVVLCLAHNGKVAWDLKWRPTCIGELRNKQRMGYLAVLLGNGSLEVWDVPLPQTMKAIHLSSGTNGTDPRFVKLDPIFRCSKLKCGDTQSIPLTVEWSTSTNPDFLLVGCHDGTVALWKFSPSKSSEDTRPLLCFSADTVPIRAVGWAPVVNDPEGANVIATAGHGGLKFWDIRDPYHPLWEIHAVPRFIYSLDWLPDPNCVVLSFDDGTMRILSLVKAASNSPATGKPFSGTKLQGFNVQNCSPFAVWNVQVSRLTGMLAYCGADGRVLRYQLTNKAVEKGPRYKTPHFICGYLTMEDSTVTVHTPLPDNPLSMKKPVNESGEATRCLRSLLSESSQGKGGNGTSSKLSVPDLEPLALTYCEDPSPEPEPEETPGSKSKSLKKAEDSNNQALVCIDEEEAHVRENTRGKNGCEIESLPPKMAAIHRVRWNMNIGSERWLCSGGAAGILRCQEVRF